MRTDSSKGVADLRLFGHKIDCPTGFAATKQGRRGAFQDFDPLDPRCVSFPPETASSIKAIDQIAGRDVLIACKAANGEGIP